jgi:outer membrane protein insertion porin family
MLNGELGYADSYGGKKYPFFKNFFMGGVSTVRGYAIGTLGPRDENNFSVGGTKSALASAELFYPIPGIKDSKQFRLSTFVDSGYVWSSSQTPDPNDLRYSAGVGVSWFSPFGPLKLIYAKPINASASDITETIQFQLGQQF